MQKSAPKKGADKKADGKSSGGASGGHPDADPLAEKLRLQRLQEAADFDAARAAFGGEAKNLDDLCPTTEGVRVRRDAARCLTSLRVLWRRRKTGTLRRRSRRC